MPGKMLRPFVWLKLPGVGLQFHMESPGGMDEGFNHLADFEYSWGNGELEAKFTLVDRRFLIAQNLLPRMLDLSKEIIQDGSIKKNRIGPPLTAQFQFGWYVGTRGDNVENPWGSQFPSKSPVQVGVIKSIDLELSEGIYTYTLTVKGPTTLIKNHVVDKKGKDEEKIIEAEDALELLEEILGRAQLTAKFNADALKVLKASKITQPFKTESLSIERCFKLITSRYCQALRGNKKKTWQFYDNDRLEIDADFVINLVDEMGPREAIRSYRVGIYPDTKVISFKPDYDIRLAAAHPTPRVTGGGAKGGNIRLDTKAGGDAKGGVLAGDTNTSGDNPREMNVKPVEAARQAALELNQVRNFLIGIKADLTILGDPGLMPIGKDGKNGAMGKNVFLKIQRSPYPAGPKGGLVWETPKKDEALGGLWSIVDGISHSMGAGRPFETTLKLKKMEAEKTKGDQFEKQSED